MICSQDSLFNLRKAAATRKRKLEQMSGNNSNSVLEVKATQVPSSSASLQELLAAGHTKKRIRRSLSTASTTASRKVSFALERNEVHHSAAADFGDDGSDVVSTWITAPESKRLKRDVQITVLALRQGLLVPETLRGLEAYVDPRQGAEKLAQRRDIHRRILQQYELLQQMVHCGLASFDLDIATTVGQLATLLNSNNAQKAADLGRFDAEEALLVHAMEYHGISDQASTAEVANEGSLSCPAVTPCV